MGREKISHVLTIADLMYRINGSLFKALTGVHKQSWILTPTAIGRSMGMWSWDGQIQGRGHRFFLN
jgi:hypothetical protein